MIRLDKSSRAWGTPAFAGVLKQELEQLGAQLPLQQGLTTGSYVTADPVSVIVISSAESGGVVRVRAGIYFQSVIAGCSCDGDPTPTGENTEYCVVQLDIDKDTAATTVAVLED